LHHRRGKLNVPTASTMKIGIPPRGWLGTW
jgi:hypothetical protein